MVDVGWQVSVPGLALFLALVAAWAGLLWISRRVSLIRAHEGGIVLRGLLSARSYPWAAFSEMRRQHGELELVGDRFRLPMRLDILSAGGTPLIIRRGRYAFATLPMRLFLVWLRGRLADRQEPPIAFSRRDRILGRLVIGAIIAANVALFLVSRPFEGSDLLFARRLERLGAVNELWRKEPWRLFASLFLHGTVVHISFNMIMLAALGKWAGKIFGWTRTVLIYLAGGVLGNWLGIVLRSWWAGGSPIVSVGASTAILAMFGALLGATYRRPDAVPLAARIRFRWAIPVSFILLIGFGYAIPMIDNYAHAGGFAAGFLLAWPIPPRQAAPRDAAG
jgi:membrane associated rhomboid family serine protease